MSGVGQVTFMNQRSFATPPVNTVLPVISGTAALGQTLSTTDGTWTGTSPITFAYQWQRGVTNIGGATSSTYTVQAADFGFTLRCVVTATNAASSVSANSADTATIPFVQELWSWGDNYGGALGQNIDQYVNRSSPVQIGALTTWYKVDGGSLFAVATKTDGTMWSWGRNNYGQLGLNISQYVNRSSPVQIGALTTWDSVSTGSYFAAAVKTDGTLWTWGSNNAGQLGTGGPLAARSSPVQVGALTTWYKTSSGAVHVLAIKTDGTLWAWGAGGELGHNDTDSRSSPVQIGALTTWANISAGGATSFAIKTDGTLWAWGNGSDGRLGLNDTNNRSSPVQVGALTAWANVAAGIDFTVAIKTDGTMWSWGRNNIAQLGLNDTYNNRSSPVQIGALTTWANVAAGGQFAVAIKTDGTLWAWGFNGAGQLGIGDATARSSPVQVGALTAWVNIAVGNSFTIALKAP